MSESPRVLGPLWLLPERTASKKVGMLGTLGFVVQEPTTLPTELYPSYMIVDSKRPSVFDCHLIECFGRLVWPVEDAQRQEIHVEHDCQRIYSHKEITSYRTKLAYISGQSPLDGSKKVKPALIRSIFEDLQVASPMSTQNSVPIELLPLQPTALSFSIRDLKSVWLETSQRQLAQLTLATGLKLGLLMNDAQIFIHTLTHRLKTMHIFCVRSEPKVLRGMLNKCSMLASMSANTRKMTKEDIRTAKLEIIDPYDDDYILAGVAKFVQKLQRKQQKQAKTKLQSEQNEEFAVSSESDSGGEAYYDARYIARTMHEYGAQDENVGEEIEL